MYILYMCTLCLPSDKLFTGPFKHWAGFTVFQLSCLHYILQWHVHVHVHQSHVFILPSMTLLMFVYLCVILTCTWPCTHTHTHTYIHTHTNAHIHIALDQQARPGRWYLCPHPIHLRLSSQAEGGRRPYPFQSYPIGEGGGGRGREVGSDGGLHRGPEGGVPSHWSGREWLHQPDGVWLLSGDDQWRELWRRCMEGHSRSGKTNFL